MRLAIVLALALALVFSAAAAAKEVTRVDVCGAGGCARLTDHATLEAFMQGGEMAHAAPSGPQQSYLLKVYMREGPGASHQAWTSRWLPAAGLIASEDSPGQFNFTSVGPKLERALRGAARGRTARAARRFGRSVPPVAQVDEVVTAPAAAKVSRAGDGGGGPPYLWIGVAAGLLLVGGGAARA
ncbi:MAG: hypothetical protein V7607_2322, partial [Solirubrobacteraceae bacterium]